MHRLDLDMFTGGARPVAQQVSFLRIGDENANGDYSHLWHVTSRGGRAEHHSTCAISGFVRTVLSNEGDLSEASVLAGLARIYRRNMDDILKTPNALVIATRGQLAMFASRPPDDRFERVVQEAENLAFALGQLPAVVRAGTSATAMQIPLPTPVEWLANEPIVRIQSSHAAFREFFDAYQALAAASFAPSTAEQMAALVQRCSLLCALALREVGLSPLEGLRITTGH